MNLLKAGSGVKALILRGDTVLILQKPGGKQDLPGGRVEGQETPLEALGREIVEEIGAPAVKVIRPLATWSFVKKSGLRVDGTTWLCYYVSGEIVLSAEHSGFFWKSLSGVKDMEICHKYGLEKLMTDSKILTQEGRETYDPILR